MYATISEAPEKDNMPNANIERAIKKGTGEDKDALQLYEAQYEAMGPCGTAFMITALTDNKNRTFPNVRNQVEKKGGTMGESGSVSWMFDKKGVIIASGLKGDSAEMAIIESGADNYEANDDGAFEIYTDMKNLHGTCDSLKKSGFEIEKAGIHFVPKSYKTISDKETAEKIIALGDSIEEDEDVTDVSGNFDIDESVMQQLKGSGES